MPSGPKKRRAAKKKEQVGSETLASGFVNIAGETDNKPNQSDEKIVELQDEISNQGTFSVSHTEDVVGSEDAEKTGSIGLSSVTRIESLQITGDKSAFDESNRVVGSDGLAASDLLTSREMVKNIASDIKSNEWAENVLDENNDESSQSAYKTESLFLEKSCSMTSEDLQDVASDRATVLDSPPPEPEEVEEFTGNLLSNDINVFFKHVFGMEIAEIAGLQGSRNTEDKYALYVSSRASGSERSAVDLLARNEPVKNVMDENDHESFEKALSDIVEAADLQESTEDKSADQTNQAPEIITTEPVKSDVDKSVHETNHVVEKSVSEMLIHESIQSVGKAGSEVMNPTDEVTLSIQSADNDVYASGMVDVDLLTALGTEIIHGEIAINKMDDGLVKMPNDEEEGNVQLLIEKSGSTVTEDVQNSCDTEYGAMLNKLISDSRSSSRMKHVKEVLEKELMETEKLRLVLKKAVDKLTLAINPDVVSA